MKFKLSALAAATALAFSPASQAGEVEVLHYWTSGGEAASVNYLKDKLASAGVRLE